MSIDNPIDTRKRFEVPLTLTLKVEDETEAKELAENISTFLVSTVKGVSMTYPPVVGDTVTEKA